MSIFLWQMFYSCKPAVFHLDIASFSEFRQHAHYTAAGEVGFVPNIAFYRNVVANGLGFSHQFQ